MPELVNISSRLTRAAEKWPDRVAVMAPAGADPKGPGAYDSLTFRALDQEADRLAHGLARIGIARGTRTILMVRPSIEFFSLTFALFRVGAVPVLIDPGMGRKRMAGSLAAVGAEAFIGIPKAQVLRLLHRASFRTVKIVVTVGRRWFWRGHPLGDLREDPWKPYEAAATQAQDPAAILFTSGSTGPPKGVLYEHGMFDAQVRVIEAHFAAGPEDLDLATFALFALFDAALGITAILPDMDFSRPAAADPRKILNAIRDLGATRLFASPALLDRIGIYAVNQAIRPPTLRRVLTAGAPVRAETLALMREILPEDATIFTPYGATEALPLTSIESREILTQTRPLTAQGAGICVGKPVGGIELRIIEIADGAIPAWKDAKVLAEGEVGEVVVKGPVVTRAYHENPDATFRAKIREGEEVWHRMGDAGYLDREGRLWYCGRVAHRVVTPHGTLFSVPCEEIFNGRPNVKRTALVGLGNPPAQRPVLCVEPRASVAPIDHSYLKRDLIDWGRRCEMTRPIDTVLVHPGPFPVDVRHNAKIDREALARWARQRLEP